MRTREAIIHDGNALTPDISDIAQRMYIILEREQLISAFEQETLVLRRSVSDAAHDRLHEKA